MTSSTVVLFIIFVLAVTASHAAAAAVAAATTLTASSVSTFLFPSTGNNNNNNDICQLLEPSSSRSRTTITRRTYWLGLKLPCRNGETVMKPFRKTLGMKNPTIISSSSSSSSSINDYQHFLTRRKIFTSSTHPPHYLQRKISTVRHYTDERLDVELDFETFQLPRRHHPLQRHQRQRRKHARWQPPKSIRGRHRNSNNLRKPSPFFFVFRFMLPVIQFCHTIKEILRTNIFERTTVYILQCENQKYYVGSTTNRKRRYHQHMHQRGSRWTKLHKPIALLKEYRRIPSKYLLGMESKVTAETMLQYGVNNVRGSMFCNIRNYHMGDIDALTKFIGHYNDLEYGSVYSKLCRMLPQSPLTTSVFSQNNTMTSEGGGVGRRRHVRKNKNIGVEVKGVNGDDSCHVHRDDDEEDDDDVDESKKEDG